MKNICNYLACLFAGSLLLTACHQSSSRKEASHNQQWLDSLKTLNEKKPEPKMQLLGEGSQIKLLAYQKPLTGYDHFYIAAADTNELKNGKVAVTISSGDNKAVMVDKIAQDSLYKSTLPIQILFSKAGNYRLKININNKTTEIPLEVKSSTELLKTVKLGNGEQLLVALARPQMPQKGFNVFELGLYNQQLKPLNNYAFKIEPLMPSMGHGSHYNINPLNVGNGLYRGRANFMMEGEWLVKVKLLKNKEVIDSTLNFSFKL